MRKFTWLIGLLCVIGQMRGDAQVAINRDSTQPDVSAMLDIKSSSKGLLIPRMTAAQRTAIATPADGLLVYDTDSKTFWFYQGGTGWMQSGSGGGGGGGGSLTIPDSLTFASNLTLLSLTNSGAGGALQGIATGTGSAILGQNTNSSNVANTLNITSNTGGSIGPRSLGNAGNFFVNNTNAVSAGVRGEVNTLYGNEGAAGIYGVASGTGGFGGYFEQTSTTGYGLALYATTAAQGIAAHFESTNTTNALPTVEVITDGIGQAMSLSSSLGTTTANILNVSSIGQGVIADHSQGNAANFFMNNTNGVGAAVRGETNSIFGNYGTAGVYGTASGTGGYGGFFEHSNTDGYGNAIYATNAGLGTTVEFETTNSANAQPVLLVTTGGTGEGLDVSSTNTSTTVNLVNVTALGGGVIADHSMGNAANFFINNTNGIGAGVRGETNSIFGNYGAAGIYGTASGSGGYGGFFEHSSGSGFGMALEATTNGQGYAADFETNNTGNSQPTVNVVTTGTGSGLFINSTNTSTTVNVVDVTAFGGGVIADHSMGNAGNFFMNNTNGVGAGVRGETNTIFGNFGAAGVYGTASGTGGYGGFFEHSNTDGYGIALQAVNNGLGPAFVADVEGSGDLAVFQAGGTNVARINHSGAGLFNGGLAAGGADLAEAFEVEGSLADYEPGDVLLISTTIDRTVVKSNEAYSSLVAGVYATKPGAILTEGAADQALCGKVPMGVVGVIPTKVCGEGGPIHRGDILVTAPRPGYAMKADLNKLRPGQAIGKALQEFAGEAGMIKVLVNVK